MLVIEEEIACNSLLDIEFVWLEASKQNWRDIVISIWIALKLNITLQVIFILTNKAHTLLCFYW